MKIEDREFFARVKLAIFTNPFSEERAAVNQELTRVTADEASSSKTIDILTEIVARKIEKIRTDLKGNLKALSTEDLTLIRYGMLFHIFHQFAELFDQLIEEQILAGEAPCKVPFAADALAKLSEYGFQKKEAVRFFAIFFQMRRAFYFINKIVGTSRSMKELRRNLWNNIFTHDIGLYDQYLWNRMEDFSTMLLGETGTGKGMAAAAIGRSGFIPFNLTKNCFSENFCRTFISINLSQYPEQLLESELFGHKKGSFTGAIDTHVGTFSRCSPCGAIFLDEIGEVSEQVQIKLLQVLQERTFCQVGSHQTERFSGRVIAATNQNINRLRHHGSFRDDFYYRLCSDVIEIPPLRQRLTESPTELDEILMYIICKIIGKPSPDLASEIKSIIIKDVPKDYPWTGNVRELEQCIRRILIKKNYEGGTQISPISDTDKITQEMEAGAITAQQLLSSYCKNLYNKFGTYEAVAQRTELDRRTVKKYIDQN
ncbi:MAG: sigma 54-interacting transcriptional regulator [Proteobacteria bacterium]|nr:sigma 54-interacting transcriptional regulator [Pseudomonadota bacterium]MBU1716670.1 sigma 54-interacting transcriptional regulator [Pseudomonadota bacterium]